MGYETFQMRHYIPMIIQQLAFFFFFFFTTQHMLSRGIFSFVTFASLGATFKNVKFLTCYQYNRSFTPVTFIVYIPISFISLLSPESFSVIMFFVDQEWPLLVTIEQSSRPEMLQYKLIKLFWNLSFSTSIHYTVQWCISPSTSFLDVIFCHLNSFSWFYYVFVAYQ